MLLHEEQNKILVYRADKSFDEKVPFFIKNRKKKALRQISKLSRYVNLYHVYGPDKDGGTVSIYLAPRLFSFLLQHYLFDEYSDCGYSIFGNAVHELPSEYLTKQPDHLVVVTSNVMFGTLEHLENPSWSKFKVIAKTTPKGETYAD